MLFKKQYENSFYTYQDSRFYVQDFSYLKTIKKAAILLDGAIEIPPTCGMIYRLFHLSIALKHAGIDMVWIIRNRNFLKIEDFERLKNHNIRIHILPDQKFYNIEYIINIIQKDGIELIQFEVTQDFLYFASNIKDNLKIPIVLEVHESDYLLRTSIDRSLSGMHLVDFIQRTAIQIADAVICMTKSEQSYLNSSSSPEKFFLAPNGIEGLFTLRRKKNPDPIILLLGNLFYYPNRQAAIFLIEKVLPLVNQKIQTARLKIIGMLPDDLKNHYANNTSVEFMGEIKDLTNFHRILAEGYLGICPVLSGAGMKVKILNYAAAGLPIISTPIGAMGYEDLKGLIICNESPVEIAQKIVELLSSESQAQEYGELIQASVIENYSWASIVQQVIAAYSFAYHSVHAEKKDIKKLPPSLFFEEKRHMEEVYNQHVVIEKEVTIPS